MAANPEVKSLVAYALTAQGYTGLYNDETCCGCEVSDLAPCWDGPMAACQAGYKILCRPEDCHTGDDDSDGPECECSGFTEGAWRIQAVRDRERAL